MCDLPCVLEEQLMHGAHRRPKSPYYEAGPGWSARRSFECRDVARRVGLGTEA